MLSKSILSVLVILFYVQNTFANCLLNNAIFSSEDGKDKFIVDKVAYKREHSCWFENKNGYDFEYPPIYIEVYSPNATINRNAFILKNSRTGEEKIPNNCNTIRQTVTLKGSYNNKPYYIIEDNISGQLPCCKTEKFTQEEFKEIYSLNKSKIQKLRWLTNSELERLNYTFGSSEIQMYDYIKYSGPILLFDQCQS